MEECQLLEWKEISAQEGSLEVKIREWKDVTYLLLFSDSSKGDNRLACTQLCMPIIHQRFKIISR